MKVSFVAAIIVALPVLLWQTWQFVAPGLYEHEKRYTRSFVFFGSLFFLVGAAFFTTWCFSSASVFCCDDTKPSGCSPDSDRRLSLADFSPGPGPGVMFELRWLPIFSPESD